MGKGVNKRTPSSLTQEAPQYNEFDLLPQKQFTSTTRGRGAGFNPGNRFESTHIEKSADDVFEEDLDPERTVPTEFFRDHTRTVLAKNDSPDIPFTYSVNPYRGCEHGCIYCYARPSHEYLGFSSGLDFETKILVKYDAPRLLEEAFRKRSWEPQVVALSGNTDCYQPVERTLKITRELLKVFLRFQNPVRIVTKNFLVTRDLDLLRPLAEKHLVGVMLSITTLDRELARRMEPRTSTPQNRLKAIEVLSKSGISVGVLTSPVIPGLTDHEFPEILRLASEAGARSAGYTIVRLSHALKELFRDWLERELPTKKDKILHSIESVRGGKLSSSEFGKRMRGEGELADHIARTFKLFAKRYGLNRHDVVPDDPAPFLRTGGEQTELFGN
jgi:DNA repair photolyase